MTPFDTGQTDRLLMTTKAVRRRLDLAEILGIPTTWDQTCLIPVAYTTGGDFSPSPRAPVEDSIVWNHGAAS